MWEQRSLKMQGVRCLVYDEYNVAANVNEILKDTWWILHIYATLGVVYEKIIWKIISRLITYLIEWVPPNRVFDLRTSNNFIHNCAKLFITDHIIINILPHFCIELITLNIPDLTYQVTILQVDRMHEYT